MNLSHFLGELKRRNVYRVAVTYAVVSWLLIQIATQVSPYFAVPTWPVRVLILLLVGCFPVALTLAWAFELTPEGFRRTEDVPPHRSIRHRTGRKLVALSTIVAAVALAMFLIRSAGFRAFLDAGPAETGDAASSSVPDKSIAVLPFANLSAEKDNEFFADGVQDEILASLARIADLKVISRTSVQLYRGNAARNVRQIGRQLGVAHVLEGSVQRMARRVRVTVQLIDARNDAHLWGEHFDRDLSDAFAIESDIAEAVAGQLKAQFSPTEKAAMERPTSDAEAFDLYLRAKQSVNTFDDAADRKEALMRALRLLDEAITRDPKFALAYCWAATAHDSLYWFGYDRSAERLALARASAQTALALAPNSGDAHLAQARVLYHGNRDYTGALREAAIAQRTLPNSAELYSLLGWIARRQGRWEEALKNEQKAAELDPRNVKVLNSLSVLYDLLRRYDDKEALYDRSAAINPAARDYCQLLRTVTETEKGNLDTAEALLASIPESYDPGGATTAQRITLALYRRQFDAADTILSASKLTQLTGTGGVLLPKSWFEGAVAAARGDIARSRAAFNSARLEIESAVRSSPDDAVELSLLAIADAALGRPAEALSEVTRAMQLRPIEQDALDGATVLGARAMVFVLSGDAPSAIEQLELLAKRPGGPDYGDLKYNPVWDPLRQDARFAAMLTSLEPPKTR